MVYDGTGAEPRQADVVVAAGIIAAITPVAATAAGTPTAKRPAPAGQVVDANSLALTPGIIDSHTHYDAQITWACVLRPSPALGVTTAAIGNCGFTIAPCRAADRELTMHNLTQVEGMSLEVLRQGIDWGFESFAEYLAQLRRGGCVLNVAAYLGHSSLRTWVLGAEASKRAATDDEIARMQTIVHAAMHADAVGFASSTSPAHNGQDGTSMPSRLIDDRELAALVAALGESGRGVFMLTNGGQTPVPFLESLTASSGRPVMIAALLHNGTNP